MPILILIFILVVACPSWATAQSAPTADARRPTSALRLPRWEAAVVTAGFFGHPEQPGDATRFADDDWYGSGQFGVMAGRYWTTHLKTEIDLTMTSEARRYVQRFARVPNLPSPLPYSSEQFFQTRQVSLGVAWQFLENEWVHPYLLGGVAVDFERVRTRTWPQSYYTSSPSQGGTQVVLTEGGSERPITTLRARGVVGAGAKFYMSPKTFFRAEARGGLGPRVEHLAFRAGIGLDF